MKVKEALVRAKGSMVENSPSILTGLGVVGVISTATLAVKATPLAQLEVEQEEVNLPKGEFLTKKEVLRITWKHYIPAAVMGLATIGCIIGANRINLKRNAALAGLYSVTESTMKKYQEKVIEQIGEKEHNKIKDKLAEERINENPVENDTVFITGNGDTLCYDALSGRYFRSSQENIRRAQNDFNKTLIDGYYDDLNAFYSFLGLSDIEMGHNVGWTADKLMDIYFSSTVAANGQPCLVVNHDVMPDYQFNKM